MAQAAQDGAERLTVVSVLIATRDRRAELEVQLRSLESIQAPEGGWELLVIDNGSSDDTPGLLRKVAEDGRLPLRALCQPRRGKSRALNQGILAARGELLAFTDDDAMVQPQWLRAFESAASAHAGAIGFAGRAPALGGPAPAGHGIINYEHGDRDFEIRPFETPPPGVNFAFRRQAFERYGLFREDLGPGSSVQRAEDTEFVRRLWLGGERLRYVADAVVQNPVRHERLSRRFALRWMFWLGRSNARMTGRPAGVRTVGGVPRYVYGSILRGVGRVAQSFVRERPPQNFAAVRYLAYDLGLAYEFLSLPRDFDPRAMVRPLAHGCTLDGPTVGAPA